MYIYVYMCVYGYMCVCEYMYTTRSQIVLSLITRFLKF